MRKAINIQTSGGNIRGHQNTQTAFLETGQSPGPGSLALVAVNGSGIDASAHQLLGQAVSTVLGAGEDQHLVPATLGDQLNQQVAFG